MKKTEYRDVRWVVEEVLSIVNGLNLPAIHEDLSFRQRKAISRKVRAADEEEHRLFERDPFIYFYEDYLKAYDPATRKSRGVYYTPPPVVNFIVRAMDDILKGQLWNSEMASPITSALRCSTSHAARAPSSWRHFERIFDNIGGPTAGTRRSDRARALFEEHFWLRVSDRALHDRAL